MKSITTIIKALKSLSFGKVWQLMRLGFSNPIFAVLSAFATIKTLNISKKYYPKTNETDGIGNAFRHAFWCCMIMAYCCKVSSPKKAEKWCKRMTDFHEELFPNNPLQQKMDLHNNAIGIRLFLEMLKGIHRQFFEPNFFVEVLQKKVKTAQILHSEHQILSDELVYLQ